MYYRIVTALNRLTVDLIVSRLVCFPVPSLSSLMGPNPTGVARLGAGKPPGARARLPLLLSGLAIFVCLPAYAATPLTRTTELIEVLKEVKTVPRGKILGPEDHRANTATFKRLDEFYDFSVLASEPLAPHKDKLTPEQQTKIKTMFEELLRLVAYPKSGSFLRDAKYGLEVGSKRGDIKMHAARPDEDFEATVIFHWRDTGGTLRIVDVSFDGVSLVKDYTNQFGRIIKQEGGDGLVKKLSTRLEKERRKQGV